MTAGYRLLKSRFYNLISLIFVEKKFLNDIRIFVFLCHFFKTHLAVSTSFMAELVIPAIAFTFINLISVAVILLLTCFRIMHYKITSYPYHWWKPNDFFFHSFLFFFLIKKATYCSRFAKKKNKKLSNAIIEKKKKIKY